MACIHCRAAKVRCDRQKQIPCSYCTRLGLTCIPHISRQGQRPKKKRKASSSAEPNLSGLSTLANLIAADDNSSVATATASTSTATRPSIENGMDGNTVSSSSSQSQHYFGDGLPPSEDGCISYQISKTGNPTNLLKSPSAAPNSVKNHYGIRYLIRSWIAFAFRRRSFCLLSRAASLAVKFNIPMDDILCDTPSQRGMDHLYPILLVPRNEQKLTSGTSLTWNEIPNDLLVATNCGATTNSTGELASSPASSAAPASASASATVLKNREQRWIWIREIKQGMSRYLTTIAFERDICPWSQMNQAWKENQHPVISLFLPTEKEYSNHTRGLVCQVLKYVHGPTHTNATTATNKNDGTTKSTTTITSHHHLESTRISRTRLRVMNHQNNQSTSIQTVDQLTWFRIVDLDHAYCFIEYVPVVDDDSKDDSHNHNNNNNNKDEVHSSEEQQEEQPDEQQNYKSNQPERQLLDDLQYDNLAQDFHDWLGDDGMDFLMDLFQM